MIDYQQLEENVKRGAAWIDEAKPEWWKTIDLEQLNMGLSDVCILGQTYGSYGKGLMKIHGGGERAYITHMQWSKDHGFLAITTPDTTAFTLEGYVENEREEYAYLSKLWEAEIQDRRIVNE